MNINNKIRNINHQRIDQSRKLKIFLFNLIFSPFTKISALNEAAPILVLRMDDKLGDSITATGFLRSIKNNLPNNKLIVVSGVVSSVIYKKFDFIDEVIVAKKGFINTLVLFFKLNIYKYSAIINTSHILNPGCCF
jgi:hypothetical protein